MQENGSCRKFGRIAKFSQPAKFRTVAKFESCEHYSPACHCSHFSHCSPLLLFHAFVFCFFLLQFFVSSHFVLVIAFDFGFFGNFLYTEHLYKPQSSFVLFNHFCNKFFGRSFQLSRVFHFLLHFPSFSWHFLGRQTPSEDDNSEDEWLKPLSP